MIFTEFKKIVTGGTAPVYDEGGLVKLVFTVAGNDIAIMNSFLSEIFDGTLTLNVK